MIPAVERECDDTDKRMVPVVISGLIELCGVGSGDAEPKPGAVHFHDSGVGPMRRVIFIAPRIGDHGAHCM
ncbi:hypothetical protein GCM10017557_53360 [Streptomyces aurantiacus]|uniref:Uncharacterized protein n=1 Tax=Streptomyces aurantiacus TaxID=47760 RepID=A0A7G1P9T0_9ACTN|nr:hypothetical protein GCM10017557_53360 [Streptomyces aurantiacus]